MKVSTSVFVTFTLLHGELLSIQVVDGNVRDDRSLTHVYVESSWAWNLLELPRQRSALFSNKVSCIACKSCINRTKMLKYAACYTTTMVDASSIDVSMETYPCGPGALLKLSSLPTTLSMAVRAVPLASAPKQAWDPSP